MTKRVAIVSVVAWGAFWVFGAMAVLTPPADGGVLVMDTVLAACGGAVGLWCHLRLNRGRRLAVRAT